MTVEDEHERQLEIITQWQESYHRLRLQMRCENIIASGKRDFSVLSTVTETWVPACGLWVGDYPYLDRREFREFVIDAEEVDRIRELKIKRNRESGRIGWVDEENTAEVPGGGGEDEIMSRTEGDFSFSYYTDDRSNSNIYGGAPQEEVESGRRISGGQNRNRDRDRKGSSFAPIVGGEFGSGRGSSSSGGRGERGSGSGRYSVATSEQDDRGRVIDRDRDRGRISSRGNSRERAYDAVRDKALRSDGDMSTESVSATLIKGSTGITGGIQVTEAVDYEEFETIIEKLDWKPKDNDGQGIFDTCENNGNGSGSDSGSS